MDLATDLGEQGFRWIFVVNTHRGPSQNRILNQAGDYFHDIYGGHMVNLEGLIYQGRARLDANGEEEQREDAGSTHAGTGGTSLLLLLRPDLVNPAYKNAEPLPARDPKHRIEIAKASDWPGYWGSPRLATAAAAAARWKVGSSRRAELALKILDGFDYSRMTRFGDETVSGESSGGTTFPQHNQEVETKQSEWLRQKGLE
jgi:creatinine amidohydrolase/Fe(II)-dependent formamide hydrolase-like protein